MDKIIERTAETPEKETEFSDETLSESGFEWRERDGVRLLVCTELTAKGFKNAFSTRLGGVSPIPQKALNLAGFGEDSKDNIYENRRRFLRAIGGDFELATVWQVHGDTVKIATSASDAAASEDRADALVSDLDGILVGVKTADCVPILLGDPRTGAFAAVHAGWRGTVHSIVKKSVNAMIERFGSTTEDIVCAIGPAAGCSNYEIGQDVIDAFSQTFADADEYIMATRPGHALIDLQKANKIQLLVTGVCPDQIFTAPFCTIERNDLFFSYRIEKTKYGKTGRLLSVIGRTCNSAA